MTDLSVGSSGVEVTREDFQKHFSQGKTGSKRFRFRWPKNSSQPTLENEVLSVTSGTITSIDTLKVSNRTHKEKPSLKRAKSTPTMVPTKKGWQHFKKKITAILVDDAPPSPTLLSTRSRSDLTSKTDRSLEDRTQSDLSGMRRMDDDIRGRRDGLDVLSLGPARLPCSPSSNVNDMDLFIEHMNPPLTPQKLVVDIMSRGRDVPEMVLEGFLPGGEDRWIVRMEPPSQSEHCIARLLGGGVFSESSEEDSTGEVRQSCGPAVSCGGVFMESMWGLKSTPPPTHATVEEDDVLKLASQCNIPIDIDEDTFIIETANHLLAIHDIAAISLRRGDYDATVSIFEKILKGLRIRHEKSPHFLIATTLHNIGVIRLCQGKMKEALEAFREAVTVRTETLKKDHPDVAVSLVRQGMAQFALGMFSDAIESLSTALEMSPRENGTRAKILNNLGVVQYHNRETRKALRSFAGALEIQRQRLENPVRRESTILDASTTLSNMGKLYLEKSDFDTAFIVFEEALLLQQTAFRKDSPLVLESVGNLAYTNAKNEDITKAILLYTGLMHHQENRLGKESREYCETMGILGLLFQEAEDYEEALQYLNVSYRWQQSNMEKAIREHTYKIIKKVQLMVQRAHV